MYNSQEKIDFVIEYISLYEVKIKRSNKNGLYDNAKMFELFALEVCKLIYNQDFFNLNDEKNKNNYPYIDLISEDGTIFVQVTTVEDLPTKIRNTLKGINDSNKSEFSNISDVKFFVLNNNSVNKIKDYKGKDKIGKISFIKERDLITTKDIIIKAKTDSKFLDNLYLLLKNDIKNYDDNNDKFEDSVRISRDVYINNINTLINNEYEIDRSDIIQKIKQENQRFISIQGDAGCGKTALCKKYIEDQNIVIFARAEKFIQVSNINDIWNFDINKALWCINNKYKVYFFIDALEFIADSSKTKISLLEELYSIAERYKNVYIITSCRSSDKNAFMKIISKYNIKIYELNYIDDNELNQIKQKYPIIRKLSEVNSYRPLLKIPFYINMIISKKVNIDKIEDVNSLRKYIWNNIICLKEKTEDYKIKFNDVEDFVKKITFERAKSFSLGVHKEDLDEKILQILISEGVIVQYGEYVRLKYDIYEDICFEIYFDKLFFECRGNYTYFYNEIEKIGRCVYRRYQIWISNKLFMKKNIEKFLYELIFSDNMPKKWKIQTEIGIVKSNYSAAFFKEYETKLIKKSIIIDFINIINLYSFELKFEDITTEESVSLIPIGVGRLSIIKIIDNHKLYSNIGLKNSIIKMCLDYLNQARKNREINNSVCKIIEYYIDILMFDSEIKIYNIKYEFNDCLHIIYSLSEDCKEWLEDFFNIIIENYNNGSKVDKNISREIMKWSLKHAYSNLFIDFTDKLCTFAEVLWSNKIEDAFSANKKYNLNIENEYGLNIYSSRMNITENIFLWNLFSNDINVGLHWAINFVNNSVEIYKAKNEVNKIGFFIDGEIKEFFGNLDFWLAGILEDRVPVLIGDILFSLKTVIINTLEKYKNQSDYFYELSSFIKDSIYSNSNNIFFLTVIRDIGLHFKDELPGYAIELASNIDIIYFDVYRYLLYFQNPVKDGIQRNMLINVGISRIFYRYYLDNKCNISIQEYMLLQQIIGDLETKKKCNDILDYLYSIIPNDAKNAKNYLQIQKMDVRNAEIKNIENGKIELIPKITGEAAKFVEKNKKLRNLEDNNIVEFQKDISELIEKKENINNYEFSKLEKELNRLLELSKELKYEVQCKDKIINIIVTILKKFNLEKKDREFYCNIWIQDIENVFKNKSSFSKSELIIYLFDQLEENIEHSIKYKIKLLALNILMYSDNNYTIKQMQGYLHKYLCKNNKLANALFNTIVMLAYDEMEHQKYNAVYIKEKDKDFIFIPNIQANLKFVDEKLKKENKKIYNNNYINIIKEYLYFEKELILEDFDIEKYDISILYNIVDCGLDFSNNNFKKAIRKILECIINIFRYEEKTNLNYINYILSYNKICRIIQFFQYIILKSNNDKNIEEIDILFDNINFSDFTSKTIEFYQDIFGALAFEFFISYNDVNRRDLCISKINYIGNKINIIENKRVKMELSKILILYTPNFNNWNYKDYNTKYSYFDKQFLNKQYKEYGKYYLKDVIGSISRLNIEELLPEILISIKEVLKFANKELNYFEKDVKQVENLINKIIIKAFLSYNDKIKEDQELTNAYEEILEILIGLNNQYAAIILGEFRSF